MSDTGVRPFSHPLTLVGPIVTTISASLFLVFLLLDLVGVPTSPYLGIVTFVALPALFVLGLDPRAFIGDRPRKAPAFNDDETGSDATEVLTVFAGGGWARGGPQGAHWHAGGADPAGIPGGERRVMDCVDCHDRTGHPFSIRTARAVDEGLESGLLPSLPFVRREAVLALDATAGTEAGRVRPGGSRRASFSRR